MYNRQPKPILQPTTTPGHDGRWAVANHLVGREGAGRTRGQRVSERQREGGPTCLVANGFVDGTLVARRAPAGRALR